MADYEVWREQPNWSWVCDICDASGGGKASGADAVAAAEAHMAAAHQEAPR